MPWAWHPERLSYPAQNVCRCKAFLWQEFGICLAIPHLKPKWTGNEMMLTTPQTTRAGKKLLDHILTKSTKTGTDLAIMAAAYSLAFVLRFEGQLAANVYEHLVQSLPYVL